MFLSQFDLLGAAACAAFGSAAAFTNHIAGAIVGVAHTINTLAAIAATYTGGRFLSLARVAQADRCNETRDSEQG